MKKLLLTTTLLISISACSQVETGEVGIRTTYGKVSSPPLSAGLYFYMPGVHQIHILNTKVQTVEQDSRAASKDLQNVNTKITLNYHLNALNPVQHFTRLGGNQKLIQDSIVKPSMNETFKAVVAHYTAEELVTKRQVVSDAIVKNLSDRLKQYDLFIDSVSITSFEFSEAFSAAIEAKQVAEQNANKAKNDLQRIEIEAKQKVAEAEGQAKAMQLQRQVVNAELITLKELENQAEMIKRWDGKFPSTYMGANTPTSLFLNKVK